MLTIVSEVNISIHPVTSVTGLFLWKSCKNIHSDVFRAKIIIWILFVQKILVFTVLFDWATPKYLDFNLFI